MLTDWLSGELVDADGMPQGVNTKIDLLPIDANDEKPPDVTFFGDKTRSKEVALRQDPPSVPAVYVMEDAPFVVQGEPTSSAARAVDAENLAIAIRYVLRQWETVEAFTNTYYTLRAIVMSVREFGLNSNDARRVRGDVCVLRVNNVTQLLVNEQVGDHAVTGAVTLDLFVRDTKPLG